MIFQDKKIKRLEIYDESNDNKIVARICDNKQELDNGFKVRIIPFIEEQCHEND